jgi:hypothetical protein
LFDEIALWVANFCVPSFIFSLDDLRVNESENDFKNKTRDSCLSLNLAFQTIEFSFSNQNIHAFQTKIPTLNIHASSCSQSARDFG